MQVQFPVQIEKGSKLTCIVGGIKERKLCLLANREEKLVGAIFGLFEHGREVVHVVSRENKAASHP